MNFNRAFTLVELIVVIAIIAILAAGLLAGLNPMEMIARSKDATLDATTKELLNASERWLISIQGDPTNFYNAIQQDVGACTKNICLLAHHGSFQEMRDGFANLMIALKNNGELKDSTIKKLEADLSGTHQTVLQFINEDGMMKIISACYDPYSQQSLAKAYYHSNGNKDASCGVKGANGYIPWANGDACMICVETSN